jgi:DNA polymerase III delta subunit
VFNKLGQKPLLENPELRLEKDVSFEHFLRFYSVDKPGRIKMMFEITKDGLSFWIDQAAEIPEWSTEYIQRNRMEVENEIAQLFANSIEVERKGNKTTIRVLDKNGQEVRKYKFYNGLGISCLHKKHTTKFKPYFDN